MQHPLWQPSPETIGHSILRDFMDQVESEYEVSLPGYGALWEWSVGNLPEFWNKVWDFCGVIGEKGEETIRNPEAMQQAEFFPAARLNYARNLLRRRDGSPAILFRDERGRERTLSSEDLYKAVAKVAGALKDLGIKKNDRVAGYLPNIPETVIAALAASSIGAIWSSASPDFGIQGVLDRFGQIDPKVLFCVDGYTYGGKRIDCLDKVKAVAPELKSLDQIVVIPFLDENPDIDGIEKSVRIDDFTGPFEGSDIHFENLPFNHPLFIMFSSGTTGVPKCIVHSQGGTLLQHLKEHQLHCDIKPGDRVFYFTTCGWMMWNWQITALASGAALMLYDGNPFYPNGNVLWDYTSAHGCTLFGTAAKYIDALKKEEIHPAQTHDLTSLKTITSTGSPLIHESFDFVYGHVKSDVHLASISGGTDIVSCFVLGNPVSPVWRGEIQGPGLGMAVDVYDHNGKPIPPGEGSGELVCTKPFPSMPVYFWNDDGGKKYKSAYFDRFEGIWCHGDWIERTQHNGFIIHGRSDATLNPGGVRIGTAEIYRQVEKIPEILESIAVGQEWGTDERIILFVRTRNETDLDDDLKKRIVKTVRSGASPRHVPAKIIKVEDIPRTKSNKIVEIAVRDTIHGKPVRNLEALANPEALDLYKNIDELST